MGQIVEIRQMKELGDILLLDINRSLTGQDGQAISPAHPGTGMPGLLATKLFDLGLGIDHVYVLQNQVTIRRPSGWDESAKGQVTEATRLFLRYYPDAPGADGAPGEPAGVDEATEAEAAAE